jgi:hypothetical protein
LKRGLRFKTRKILKRKTWSWVSKGLEINNYCAGEDQQQSDRGMTVLTKASNNLTDQLTDRIAVRGQLQPSLCELLLLEAGS